MSRPVAFLRLIFGCGGSLLLWAFLYLRQATAALVAFRGLLIVGVALLFPSTGRPVLQRVGSRAQAQHEWLAGLVAPRCVGSSGSGIKSTSPASARGFFTTQPPGKPQDTLNTHWIPAVSWRTRHNFSVLWICRRIRGFPLEI